MYTIGRMDDVLITLFQSEGCRCLCVPILGARYVFRRDA